MFINTYFDPEIISIFCRLLLYDDNHSLGSIKSEVDEIINSALWFSEYIPPEE